MLNKRPAMITQVNSLWDGSSVRTPKVCALFKVHIPVVSLSACMRAKFLQSCPTLRDAMNCSPPGSSVHRSRQAWMLEWVATPSSKGSSRPRDRTCISCVSCLGRWALYHYCHLGSFWQHILVVVVFLRLICYLKNLQRNPKNAKMLTKQKMIRIQRASV